MKQFVLLRTIFAWIGLIVTVAWFGSLALEFANWLYELMQAGKDAVGK
jgi:hypothetical protein